MKRKFILLAGCLLLLSLCGCLSTLIAEKSANAAAPPDVQKFSSDQSTPGADAGRLIVQCRQPSYQLSVESYAIKIDANAPLIVAKQSDTELKLNAGKHTLKLYAASSPPADSERVSYGKPTKMEIVILKDRDQTLHYTGPYRLFGEGKAEVIP